MDINLLRIAVTLAALTAFLGIVWWAYGPSRKARFERDARMVLDETDTPAKAGDGARE
jgi:cytochrome c oxidase cbb3-type subunit 4